MPIRDLLLFVFLLFGIFHSLKNPVNGVLFYALFSYLNPHRLSWGPAFNFSFAQYIALATLVGWLFYKGNKTLPLTREVLFVILLWLLSNYGWIHSFDPEGFKEEWFRFTKILIMVLLTVSVIKTEKDLKKLYMIIALSAAFYALKGAVWGVRGGTGHVWGPPGTFIEGNNEIGLFFNMCWPLIIMLVKSEEIKWRKYIFMFLSIVFPLAIVLTKSRGAALTLGFVTIMLLIRTKRKILFSFAAILVCLATIPYISDEWYSRMETIQTYEEDASAMGRINAWHAAWNMAKDYPLTGGGMRAFTRETISKYAPNPDDFHDVHSIYFEILGEIGFPGLFVFLSILCFTLLSLLKIIRVSKIDEHTGQMGNMADGLMLGIFAYMFNGIFLGLAYFDLFYQFVGMAVSSRIILKSVKSQIHEPAKSK